MKTTHIAAFLILTACGGSFDPATKTKAELVCWTPLKCRQGPDGGVEIYDPIDNPPETIWACSSCKPAPEKGPECLWCGQ